MKKVRFSNDVQVKYIYPTIDNTVKSCIPFINTKQALKNDLACIRIMNILNKNTPHQIIIVDNEELPIKISSPGINWAEDITPIQILSILTQSQQIYFSFLKEFNTIVYNTIEKNKSGSLDYISNLYNVRIIVDAVTRN